MRKGFSIVSAPKGHAPLVGVGVALEETNGGEKSVWKVAPAGPAEKVGVMVGDVFLTIDGVDATLITMERAASLCKGKEGSYVTIGIKRALDGSLDTIKIRRAALPPSVSDPKMPADLKVAVHASSSDSSASPHADAAAPGSLGLALEIRNGEKVVASVHPDGPAAAAGLVVGDVITSVDGEVTATMSTRESAERLRGVAGSDANLVVRKHSGEEVFTRIRRGPPLASGAPLYFPGVVKIVRVTADGARSLESAPLSLDGKGLTVGSWSCRLEGEHALRVGVVEFFVSVTNSTSCSFAILFPEPYTLHKNFIFEFERRLAGLTRYRSTLIGSVFNTPCPESEVCAFAERLPALSTEDRQTYFEAMRVADPTFAQQVAVFWRANGYQGDLYDRDAVDRAGRRISAAVGSLMTTDDEGNNAQAKKIVHLGGVVGETLRAGAIYTESWILNKAEVYSADVSKRTDVAPKIITTDERKAIRTAKKVTDGIVSVSGTISSGAESLGRSVGAVVTNHIPPPKDARVVAAGQLTAATIGAVAGTVNALRDASIVVLGGVRKAAVSVASKKYGHDFGGAIDESIGVVCNVGGTVVAPVDFVEKLGRGAVKSMVMETTQRVSRQTELVGGIALRSGILDFREFGIYSIGMVVIWPRAIAIYPPTFDLPTNEIEQTRVIEDHPDELRFVEVEPDGLSLPIELGGKDSWVLVEGFVPIDSNANIRRRGVLGKVTVDRIIPLNTVSKICLCEDELGSTFDIRVRGRSPPYRFQAKTALEAQQWVKTLLDAAATERKRLAVSWPRS